MVGCQEWCQSDIDTSNGIGIERTSNNANRDKWMGSFSKGGTKGTPSGVHNRDEWILPRTFNGTAIGHLSKTCIMEDAVICRCSSCSMHYWEAPVGVEVGEGPVMWLCVIQLLMHFNHPQLNYHKLVCTQKWLLSLFRKIKPHLHNLPYAMMDVIEHARVVSAHQLFGWLPIKCGIRLLWWLRLCVGVLCREMAGDKRVKRFNSWK